MPHIQARVPGRWAQAHCLDQRAARVPSAAHSLGGCSQSASEGRVAEDTPSLFMQITGELQPIVTGLSIKNRNSDGLKSPGPEGGIFTLSAPGSAMPAAHQKSQNKEGLALHSWEEMPPGRGPERMTTSLDKPRSLLHHLNPKSTGC